MYQVEAGDITVPVWRTARAELEEIFQVELPTVQLPVEPIRRVGVLIFNGHLNTNVEPAVHGWLAEQQDDHKRSVIIMPWTGLLTGYYAKAWSTNCVVRYRNLKFLLQDELSRP